MGAEKRNQELKKRRNIRRFFVYKNQVHGNNNLASAWSSYTGSPVASTSGILFAVMSVMREHPDIKHKQQKQNINLINTAFDYIIPFLRINFNACKFLFASHKIWVYISRTVFDNGVHIMISNDITKNPNPDTIKKYFNFYTQNVLPHVEKYATQNPNGCHALDKHTTSVVFRGIDYALSLNKNPLPVVFAGAFHDMARTNDGFDTEHGKRAVPYAEKIMLQFTNILDAHAQSNIIYAIENHTTGTIAPDYVSACLWDADRTRMSWAYGFNSKFFNTARAKYVASHSATDYVNFQRKCFPNLFWSREY